MLINITAKLVIVLIAGVLIGAIIATAGFLIFSKSCSRHSDRFAPQKFSQPENSGMPGGDSQSDFGKSDKSSKSQNDSGNQNRNQNQPPQKPDGNIEENMPQEPDLNSRESSN